ncbi:MAG TPA: ethylbenzene dehydrogenase-related protein [bacterium]|nr:ethylbenzene dehydrogenase-related protein [bacterium]
MTPAHPVLWWTLLLSLLALPAVAAQPEEGSPQAPAVEGPAEPGIAEDPDTGELYYVDHQGIPLTPQDDPDYPSHAVERFDFARIINQDPRLDGTGDEAVWAAVPDHTVPLYTPGTSFTNPAGTLHVKGFHNGRIVYFLCVWQDPSYDDAQGTFVWSAGQRRYIDGPEDQDALQLLWKFSGDFWGYRLKGAGCAGDEWRWGAALTNTTGYAEDRWRVHLRAQETGLPQETLKAEDGRPVYVSAPGDQGSSCYRWLPAPVAYEGDRAANVEWREPIGSAADVRARGVFTRGSGWTVEVARFLLTDNEDDRQLQTNERMDVAFQVVDGSGATLVSEVYAIRLLE